MQKRQHLLRQSDDISAPFLIFLKSNMFFLPTITIK